jgi:heptosyltransferase II
MALPTVMQLQSSGFDVWLLGRGWAKDLLAGLNVPITTVPKGIAAARRVHQMLGAERGLLFTNSLSTALSMRLAGIRAVGYRGDLRGILLHASLTKIPSRHEVEYFWRLGSAAADCWADPVSRWPEAPPSRIRLPLTNEHRVAATKAMVQNRIHGPYIVCCPMAVGTTAGKSKQWPCFAELCLELAHMGHTVVICPGPGEEQECERFRQHATVLPGLGLGAYAALMAGAETVVANDSGPMHLAAAVGVPVLGIFGSGDPIRTSPWGGDCIGGDGLWPSLDQVLGITLEMAESRRTALPNYAKAG